MSKIFQEEERETIKILAVLYSKKITILSVTLLSGIAFLCFSYFLIPKKYESEAIIYPTRTNSRQEILENPAFGFEGHANQLLQVLESNTLKEQVINKFDLAAYYEIDTSSREWYSELSKKTGSDIEFERTPYGSISITAKTLSPELSSNIVNYIVDEVNVLLQEIFKANIQQTYRSYQREYEEKEKYVNNLLENILMLKEKNTDIAIDHLNTHIDNTYTEIRKIQSSLNKLKSENEIYAYEEQVRLLSNQLANSSARYNHNSSQYNELKAVLNPKDTSLLKLKGEMIGAKKNADTARVQLEKLKNVKEEYFELQAMLNRAMSSYTELQSQKHVLENAYEPSIYSAHLEKLQSELTFSREQLQQLRTRYEMAKNKAENELPSIYVISRGRPNFKKASPSYSKSLLIGLLIGFIFSTGTIVLHKRWQIIKPRLKNLN